MKYVHSSIYVKKSYRNPTIAIVTILVLGASLLYVRHSQLQSTAYAQASVASRAKIKSGIPRHDNYSRKPMSKPTNTAGSPSAPARAVNDSAAGLAAATIGSSKTQTVAPAAIGKGLSLFADPKSNVAIQSRIWAAANPKDAARMNRLAAVPMAKWLGGWSGDVNAAANSYVSAAATVGEVPVLVTYNIPGRDCGSYSAGGADSAAAYQNWISNVATGIGQRQSIVVIEPDALAGIDCLDSAGKQSRLQLLSYAVQTLRSQTKAAIYLDAGNPRWQSANTMAERLNSAGIASASGFSLNISNFQTTDSNISYGSAISELLSGKHFIIDTSRNGNGPAVGTDAWCNPDGRQFGNAPSLQTGNDLVDAYIWVKAPGESDGNCGPTQQGVSAPTAGAWWPQYANMLAANSSW